jgi:hypothetical protein
MSTSLRRKSRIALGAGVSLTALVLAVPAVAADKVLKALAPAADRGEFRWFVEGGAFWTDGNAIPYTARGFELLSAFPVLALGGGGTAGSLSGNTGLRPNVGWDAAIGFDYRFAGTPWHVNAQARGGEARKGAAGGSDAAVGASVNQTSTVLADCCIPPIGLITSDTRSIRGISTTSADLRETHWQADFGMGYDYIPRLVQINFGVRVAEVRATTTATTNASATATRVFQLNVADPLSLTDTAISAATGSDVTSVRRSFLGAGPRVGLEGSVPLGGLWTSVPLGGLWTFDYSGNAALLFGDTEITSVSNGGASIISTLTTTAGGVVLATQTSASSQPAPLNFTSRSSSITVFNFDAQAGFSWWFNPSLKLGLSYRLDAFIDPLRAAPEGGSLSRYYHGPKLTLTGRF